MSLIKSLIHGWSFRDEKKGRGTPDLGEAMDWASKNRCCGVDCCEDVIRIKDKATGAVRIWYSKNGVVVNATEAAYEADKAAGFV